MSGKEVEGWIFECFDCLQGIEFTELNMVWRKIEGEALAGKQKISSVPHISIITFKMETYENVVFNA